jgi:hypothetical protein
MKKAIYLFAIIIALISCKEDKKIVKKDKISNFKINLVFPDTVLFWGETAL